MGSRAADWDGELVLSYRDEPLIIRTVGESNGRYTTTSIRVRLAIHLERDYELRIRPKSAMSTGLNTVLGVLDRGLEKLPSGPDLHEDYGCPEVTRAGPSPPQTGPLPSWCCGTWSCAMPCLPPQGRPAHPARAGGEGLHLVESYSYPDSMYTDWYSEPMNTGPDWTDTEEERAEKEEKLAELAQDTFFPGWKR